MRDSAGFSPQQAGNRGGRDEPVNRNLKLLGKSSFRINLLIRRLNAMSLNATELGIQMPATSQRGSVSQGAEFIGKRQRSEGKDE